MERRQDIIIDQGKSEVEATCHHRSKNILSQLFPLCWLVISSFKTFFERFSNMTKFWTRV
jgi:hypothetical protein